VGGILWLVIGGWWLVREVPGRRRAVVLIGDGAIVEVRPRFLPDVGLQPISPRLDEISPASC